MKYIILTLFIFTENVFCYEMNLDRNQDDSIFLIYDDDFISSNHGTVIIQNREVIPVEVIVKIKNIKTIEIIDYYAKMNLCYQKPKEKYPSTIVKFKVNPGMNINHINIRIKQPCINSTVSNMSISRLDIIVTTNDNRIIDEAFTISSVYQ